MSTTRRPEDVTEEEVERVYGALQRVSNGSSNGLCIAVCRSDMRKAIAAGLLVPPPRERTQMERDEEEWSERRHQLGSWTLDDARAFDLILSRLLPAAKAAGVTY